MTSENAKSEIRNPNPEIGNLKSQIPNPKVEIRTGKEIPNLKSQISDLFSSHSSSRRLGVSAVAFRPSPASAVAFRLSRGFTLIEVLATMLLLSIVLPVTMQAISTSLMAASRARHMTEATTLAQAQLDSFLATGEWENATQGDFGTDHPGYRWTCQSAAGDYNSYQVMLSVLWTERGQERSVSLSTIAYMTAGTTTGSFSTGGASGSTSTGGTTP